MKSSIRGIRSIHGYLKDGYGQAFHVNSCSGLSRYFSEKSGDDAGSETKTSKESIVKHPNSDASTESKISLPDSPLSSARKTRIVLRRERTRAVDLEAIRRSKVWRPWEDEPADVGDPGGAGSAFNYTPADTVMGHTDVLIVGGGHVGLSAAYWIKQLNPRGMVVTVVERDPTYEYSPSLISFGAVRQQLTQPENILASRLSADFFRTANVNLAPAEEYIGTDREPFLEFDPQGCLILASEDGKDDLETDYETQRLVGVRSDKMNAEELRLRFPWLNTNGILLGTYGLEDEGWINPVKYLSFLRGKAHSLGARYVEGRVVALEHRKHNVNPHQVPYKAMIRMSDGYVFGMDFGVLVNAAGPACAEIARMGKIGTEDPERPQLSVPLPVEPRKRVLYLVHCEEGPGLDCPVLFDISGLYMRREGLGGYYLVGYNPPPWEELDPITMNTDEGYYQRVVRPHLVRRIPAFERSEVVDMWAGLIDYNTYDQSLVIGRHPFYETHVFACGCSGLGLQLSPAIGRAIMEMVYYRGKFTGIDFNRFTFNRFMEGRPVVERGAARPAPGCEGEVWQPLTLPDLPLEDEELLAPDDLLGDMLGGDDG